MKNNTKLVEIVWADDICSNNYIQRLASYLNPKSLSSITTPMFNKEILPNEINKQNKYNRFMIVFNFNPSLPYQKCFCFSSPKSYDRQNDLRFFFLPNRQKIAVYCPIEIPTKYLKIANLNQMIRNETNAAIQKNLSYNRRNLNLAIQNMQSILYQYNSIKSGTDILHRFNASDLLAAHSAMIDESAVHSFCIQELKAQTSNS